jgi:hypothetical protein
MAPRVEKTPEEIDDWKQSYEPKRMQTYISDAVMGDSKAAKEVRKASVVLAKLSILKDNAELMEKAYGELYHWIWYGVAKKDGVIRLQSMNEKDCSSWKWIMQLNVEGMWWDWVSVRPSSMTKGINLGLFAERDFPVGSTVGYYAGNITWTAVEAGTEQPTSEYLATQGLEESPCASAFLNTQAVFVVVEPSMIALSGENTGECLYMGMHYIVSPQLGVKAGSTEFLEAAENVNCQLLDDGSVIITENVSAGSELLEKVNPIETDVSKEEVDKVQEEESEKKVKGKSKTKTRKRNRDKK